MRSGCSVILWLVLAHQWKLVVFLETVEELLCGNMDPGSRLPHPEFCNVYIMCTNHSAMQISCERRILYNPETEVCDAEYRFCPGGLIRNQNGTIQAYDDEGYELENIEPAKADEEFALESGEEAEITKVTEVTSTTSTSDISSTIPQSIQLISCPKVDPDKLLLISHPSKCSIYFVCYHGKPVLMECSLGLYWSEKNYKCVPRELSECHARSANPYPECPAEGIDFLPDDKNCQRFWFCRNGYRMAQQCDAFFHWDVNERKCKRIGQSVCYLDFLKSTTPSTSILL